MFRDEVRGGGRDDCNGIPGDGLNERYDTRDNASREHLNGLDEHRNGFRDDANSTPYCNRFAESV